MVTDDHGWSGVSVRSAVVLREFKRGSKAGVKGGALDVQPGLKFRGGKQIENKPGKSP